MLQPPNCKRMQKLVQTSIYVLPRCDFTLTQPLPTLFGHFLFFPLYAPFLFTHPYVQLSSLYFALLVFSANTIMDVQEEARVVRVSARDIIAMNGTELTQFMKKNRRPDGSYDLPVDDFSNLSKDERGQLAERLK